jgi:UDP-3-O-[3-hydroxymyristoyl] glucosamine N-acyltransferase
MTLKYEIQNQSYRLTDGRKVHRIKALRDFGNVKAGTYGGFVEGDDNLSHDGLCWIADDAMALGRSRVLRDAQLRNRACISDWVVITDQCVVCDDARLQDSVFVYDNAVIGEQSLLTEAVTVYDNAVILCQPRFSVSGKTRLPNLRGQVIIRDYARLEGCISVQDNVTVGDHAIVRDYARLLEKAHIGGNAIIEGRTTIGEEAMILHDARIGGRTKVFGCALVLGKVTILGRSFLTCRVRVCGHGTIRDESLSGNDLRRVFDEDSAC